MGGHRACEPAEVLFELGGLYKSTNEQTINYLVFQLFNSSSGISTAEVLRRESNAMWWGIFHGHTYVFTLTHIYAHIYRFKHLTICTHTHTLSFQPASLLQSSGIPPIRTPPLSTLCLFLLPAVVFGWLQYAHRPLRDSLWRMALRMTLIRFSPFDKFIAGILKMKLEGRLLETVFPAQVP